LHQLRRHHERLVLAHFESLRQCHTVSHKNGPVLAYLFLSRLYTAMQQEIAITVLGSARQVAASLEKVNKVKVM
jgi:hypothetical protein